MAAAAILEKFQMAISPQRLTHREVIFAITQLSCCICHLFVGVIFKLIGKCCYDVIGHAVTCCGCSYKDAVDAVCG